MERFNVIPKENIAKLPALVGIYAFYANSEAIYIGKAGNIKSRVQNHFNQPSYRDKLFISQVDKIGFFETKSEIDALILEAALIKKYQPKFNVIWRDDKSYFYVALRYAQGKHKEKIPYITITHQPNLKQTHVIPDLIGDPRRSSVDSRFRGNDTKGDKDATFIGPFTEGTALKKTLKFLRKVFPFYTSAKHPKTKCTWCHLDLCPGPVRNSPPQPFGRVSAGGVSNGAGPFLDLPAYKKNIQKLVLILKGKRKTVLNSLKAEMNQLAKENKFEQAGKIRDKIYALEQIMAHAHVINSTQSNETQTPQLHKIGDRQFSVIQDIFGANQPINRIECYDISNIQGKEATGSMVVFFAKGGSASGGKLQPDKSQYRKFKIRWGNESRLQSNRGSSIPKESGPNDIAMLKEVLQRRFNHPEWPLPDAILMDGGKAQLNAAISVIPDFLPAGKAGIRNPRHTSVDSRFPASTRRLGEAGRGNDTIKVMAIAKGRQELWIEGQEKPIPLKQLPQPVYNLIKSLDDEAHRFAITYHKKLRSSGIFK